MPFSLKKSKINEVSHMNSIAFWNKWPVRLGAGLAAGAAITYVDNFAFAGEVSPIIIVAMLLVATATAGAIWGQRGWVAVAAAWACVPLAHLVKHVLGLPDTLQPNTYKSILMLAAFTLVVAALGTGCGLLLRRLTTGTPRSDSGVRQPRRTDRLSMHTRSSDKDRNISAASWRSGHNPVYAALAGAIGLGIGWLDLHTTEVIVTILALLSAGLLLGLLQPVAAWRWALLVAVGLPVVAGIGQLLGVDTVEPIRLDPRVALLALAVGLVGCYTGVLIRRIARFTTS
jgi:hypothetical protein